LVQLPAPDSQAESGELCQTLHIISRSDSWLILRSDSLK
jgi:hypothetical protein